MIPLLFIALSLSMDAFAVSVSSGICIRGLRPVYAVRASFFFGLFQFVMPVAGWYLGSVFASYIEAFDHWIAFTLLAFTGGKMIIEAWKKKPECPPGDTGKTADSADCSAGTGDIRSLKTLLVLSTATSIDALAVGISLSIIGFNVWGSAAVIGGVTFAVCLCGFEFGRRIGLALEKWAQMAGGIILAGIGVKILIQHLTGNA
ncbi:MAG: manganese efflux pump MntP family protein [Treponema sp.]|jgi:putative Mn2+ efflux pump MntP|nr:manganese efflux pump MntP family protein [Treponema sp.]